MKCSKRADHLVSRARLSHGEVASQTHFQHRSFPFHSTDRLLKAIGASCGTERVWLATLLKAIGAMPMEWKGSGLRDYAESGSGLRD